MSFLEKIPIAVSFCTVHLRVMQFGSHEWLMNRATFPE